ncbi:MAG: hypothetical protein IKT08_02915 [Bacteroidales bacterium]|nr:hypothetical protein [Bacteroidales bacterium]
MRKQSFSANGKLLLTGEYLVLKGAVALAVPTQLGQTLIVGLSQCGSPTIQWNAFQPEGSWLSATLSPDTLEVLSTDDQSKAEKLARILKAVRQLNPEVFKPGLRFETHLEFDPQWGLGSSSTLLSNLARWAEVDPYQLLKMTIGGSGYDIACATSDTPIFYRLENDVPMVHSAAFNPPFVENLFFVYQGNKQHSSNEVARFNEKMQKVDLRSEIEKVSDISRSLPRLTTLDDFQRAVNLHEEIMSRCLDRPPVQLQYPDFEGSLKSLGAWGGDFLLGATIWPLGRVKEYFHSHGLDTVFQYQELINHNIS